MYLNSQKNTPRGEKVKPYNVEHKYKNAIKSGMKKVKVCGSLSVTV